MKTNSEICDTIQFSISDKFDSGLALEQSEQSHLNTCSDCKQFYEFVHADSFHALVTNSPDKAFAVEQVCQTAAIMEKLQQPSATQEKKRNKIISITSISLATAAAAAVAAITISSQLQPGEQTPDGAAEVVDAHSADKNTSLVKLPNLPKITLEERYAALNNAVEDKLETVSYSIMKLKACFIEGNAFLDEHTKEKTELAPESRFEYRKTSAPMV